jgi:hypothetical protein
MADVHNYDPTAGELATVVIGMAERSLVGGICPLKVNEAIGRAFATSSKDLPLEDFPQVLIMLLAAAVTRQSEEIAALKRQVVALDTRTIGSIVMGPAAATGRQLAEDARRKTAIEELKAKMGANPDWVAARQKLNDGLAARRAARESGGQSPPAAPSPPLPGGGISE